MNFLAIKNLFFTDTDLISRAKDLKKKCEQMEKCELAIMKIYFEKDLSRMINYLPYYTKEIKQIHYHLRGEAYLLGEGLILEQRLQLEAKKPGSKVTPKCLNTPVFPEKFTKFVEIISKVHEEAKKRFSNLEGCIEFWKVNKVQRPSDEEIQAQKQRIENFKGEMDKITQILEDDKYLKELLQPENLNRLLKNLETNKKSKEDVLNKIREMEEKQIRMELEAGILMESVGTGAESEDLFSKIELICNNMEYNKESIEGVKEDREILEEEINDALQVLDEIKQKTPLTEQEIKGLKDQRDLIGSFFKYAQEDLEQLQPSEMELPIDMQVKNTKDKIEQLTTSIDIIKTCLDQDRQFKNQLVKQERLKQEHNSISKEIRNLTLKMEQNHNQMLLIQSKLMENENNDEIKELLEIMKVIGNDITDQEKNINNLQKSLSRVKEKMSHQAQVSASIPQKEPLTDEFIQDLIRIKQSKEYELAKAQMDLANLQARQTPVLRPTRESQQTPISGFRLDGDDSDDGCSLGGDFPDNNNFDDDDDQQLQLAIRASLMGPEN
jgi:hypothetical protein